MRLLPVLILAACAPEPNQRPDFGPPSDPSLCDAVGLEAGDCAPDFTLTNQDGTPIRLHDKVGERLVVVGSSMW